MQLFIRGEAIKFPATFIPEPGFAPASATLRIRYKVAGVVTNPSYVMTPVGDTGFTYTWDSAVADLGTVDYRIVTAPAPAAVKEGTLKLVANGS